MNAEPMDDTALLGHKRHGVPLAPAKTPRPRRKEDVHPDHISLMRNAETPMKSASMLAVSGLQGTPILQREQDDSRSESRKPKGPGNP